VGLTISIETEFRDANMVLNAKNNNTLKNAIIQIIGHIGSITSYIEALPFKVQWIKKQPLDICTIMIVV
jgi:hypothetical protein